MPIVNGQYQAPTWVNGKRPAINASELQAISDTLQNVQNGIFINFENFSNDYSMNNSKINSPALNAQAENVGVASVGNYAIFAGGSYNGAQTAVTAFDEALTKNTPTSLPYGGMTTGAANDSYAIFLTPSTGNNISVVAYDENLTQTTSVQQPTTYRVPYTMAGVSFGNYAIFAGGSYGTTYYNTVNTYDSSLTQSTISALYIASSPYAFGGSSNENYAFIGAGETSSSSISPYVTIYNTSLTRQTRISISSARSRMGVVAVNGYMLFAGGYNEQSTSDATVDVVSDSLTLGNTLNLSTSRTWPAVASLKEFAIITGGGSTSVDCFSDSLTLQNLQNLNYANNDISGVSVGNYAIFNPGTISITNGNTSAYEKVNSYSLPIPIGCSYNFPGMTSGEVIAYQQQNISGVGTITGYIAYKNATISGNHQ